MIDIERAISVGRLLLTTTEGLTSAIERALHGLKTGTVQLKQALDEAESMRDQLAADRAGADDVLDRKFAADRAGNDDVLDRRFDATDARES